MRSTLKEPHGPQVGGVEAGLSWASQEEPLSVALFLFRPRARPRRGGARPVQGPKGTVGELLPESQVLARFPGTESGLDPRRRG